MPDASAVMQLLLKTQTDFNDLEDDDPQVGSNPEASLTLTLLHSQPIIAFFVFLDLVHDLSLGQDVQDPREGVSAVPASGDGPADEDGLDQAGGGPARQ